MLPSTIPVIVNPLARSSQAERLIEMLPKLSPLIQVIAASTPEQGQEQAYQLAAVGHPLIVACGGDGTVHEVANGLARHYEETLARGAAFESLPSLGVLPGGTMNVFSHELGQPPDVRRAWDHFCKATERPVDLWRAGGKYWVQLGGVGLDAAIIQETPWERKKQFGPISYAISAFSVLSRPAPFMTVNFSNRDPVQGALVLVGNGKYYGGPIPFFPDAKLDDGLLDVLVFHNQDLFILGRMLAGLPFQPIHEDENVVYAQTEWLEVTSDTPVPAEADGELLGSTPIRFEKAAFPLRVRA